MGADDKRKAEEGLEGGPAKKAAATKLAVHPKRVRELRKGAVEGSGPVIYWCGRPEPPADALACCCRGVGASVVRSVLGAAADSRRSRWGCCD